MKQTHLKKIRVVIALVFFCLTTALFLDHNHLIPPALGTTALYLQFVPSLLQFITAAGLAAAGFIVVLLLTVLFGRIFCSTICPLGTLQDFIVRLAEHWKKPRRVRFRYRKPQTALHYGILLITAITLLYGSSVAINLLDPFSNFGRLIADLIRPIYIGLANLLVSILEFFNIYLIHPMEWKLASPITLVFPLLFLLLLIGLSAGKGRLYCNTLCPVGALLGLVSRFSVFKIKIDKAACTVCAKCSINCKAHCIRLKTKEIDFSRCVACFDCIEVCPGLGIGYQPSLNFGNRKQQENGLPEPSKRAFLGNSLLYLAGLAGLTQLANTQATTAAASSIPVSPPGSQSLAHFTQTCSACHLCISACPTQVLQPALLEYGLTGILQPRLDYHLSFCNFDCIRCGQVCPTGAILPLSKETKQSTQLGIAQFLRDRCIVYTDKTACGACAEHCPTKAVRMVPYERNLTIPEVREALCVGCGACEYACPVRPQRAIYVAAHAVHRMAQKPAAEPLKVETHQDFPF
ncbi:MAG: 4Fe-4S binding protein [Candidatus Competibacteraceae bacterium]